MINGNLIQKEMFLHNKFQKQISRFKHMLEERENNKKELIEKYKERVKKFIIKVI